MVDKIRRIAPRVSNPETDYGTTDLAAFALVVDTGSITAAARELGETKGSVSRRVSRLERTVGAPLLTRTGRAVTPTDAGRAFRLGAGRALDALEDARATVLGLDAEPRGLLRVTAPQGLGTMLLGPHIGAFLDRHPHLGLDLRLTDAVLSFTEHRIDVALRISPGLPDSSLVARRLFVLRGTLVASPGYLARHGVPVTLADLDDHRLVVPPVSGNTLRLRIAPPEDPTRPRDVPLRGTVLCHDLLFAQQAVLGDAGIAMLPDPVAAAEIASGRLIQVLADHVIEPTVSLWLVHLGGPVPSKVRAFRTFVEAIVKDPAACTGGTDRP